jgi:hypothetical protein
MTDSTGTIQVIIIAIAMIMLFNGTQRHEPKNEAIERAITTISQPDTLVISL